MKLFTKTLSALVAILCFAQVMSAQTVNQGAWMLGGSAGFSSAKVKDAENSTTFFNISPTLGYFIADDLAIGLGIDFQSVSFDGESESSFGLGPFVRYYVTDPIFIQVGADLGLDEGAGTTLGASLGYSWFVNNSVAIEPALFFNIFNADGDFSDFSVFGLSVGIQAFAGRNE